MRFNLRHNVARRAQVPIGGLTVYERIGAEARNQMENSHISWSGTSLVPPFVSGRDAAMEKAGHCRDTSRVGHTTLTRIGLGRQDREIRKHIHEAATRSALAAGAVPCRLPGRRGPRA
jgi:hypothetical protein